VSSREQRLQTHLPKSTYLPLVQWTVSNTVSIFKILSIFCFSHVKLIYRNPTTFPPKKIRYFYLSLYNFSLNYSCLICIKLWDILKYFLSYHKFIYNIFFSVGEVLFKCYITFHKIQTLISLNQTISLNLDYTFFCEISLEWCIVFQEMMNFVWWWYDEFVQSQ